MKPAQSATGVRNTLIIAALTAGGVLFATRATAGIPAPFIWNVNGNGDWQVGANWDVGVEPNSADNDVVTILNPVDPATPVVVTVGPGITRGARDLTINDTGVATKHQLSVANNTFLNVRGAITNNGVISLNSTGTAVRFRLTNAVTLSGSGELVLGGANNFIDDVGGVQNILTHASGHTIRGAGTLSDDDMGLINQSGALVSADVNGGTLTVDPGITHGFTNQGTMQAVNNGFLLFTGAGGGGLDNTGGTLRADGAGSRVRFTNNFGLTGGTVQTANDGVILADNGQDVFWNSVTVDTNTEVAIDNNADLENFDALTNRGRISVVPNTNNSRLTFNNTLTLDGGGEIVLFPSAGGGVPQIADGDGGAQTIFTNADNTISGGGELGADSLGMINQAGGTVSANFSGATLTVDPGVTHGFTNQGTMQAVSGGTLLLSGAGGGGFENAAGGTIEIAPGATLNLSGTLTHREGATLDQAGAFNINSGGTFINEADGYSPGASPGIVNVNGSGVFTNTADGVVTFEINEDDTPGVDFDTIRGAGTFNLDGGMNIVLGNGFTPDFYASIELILDTSGRNVNGTFDLLFDPIIGVGEAWAITYRADTSGTVDAVLFTRALPGDANLSGQVEQADLDAVLQNWGSTTNTSWGRGDMSGNGQVEQADLDLVLQNWGSTSAPDFGTSNVPEPAAFTTLGLLLLTRRFNRP